MNTLSIPTRLRLWLLDNCTGRLHPDQRRELTTEPLAMALLLLVPAIILLRRLLLSLFFGSGWFIGLALVALLVGSMLWRRWRFSRQALMVATLTARNDSPPFWAIWRRPVFTDEEGKTIPFGRVLPGGLRLQAGQRYLVYYLMDGSSRVLLSLAPVDHPEAAHWQPTIAFHERHKRR